MSEAEARERNTSTGYSNEKTAAATEQAAGLTPDPLPPAAAEVPAGDVPVASDAPIEDTGSGRKRK